MSTTQTASTRLHRYQPGAARFDSVLASQLLPMFPGARERALSASRPEAPAVDMNRLLEMVDDDPGELRHIVNMYLSESQQVMSELRASIQAGDWDQTERLAHRLAGTSVTCGMAAMARPLRDLEISAKAGRWSKNQALFLEARHEQARVSACLEGYGLKKIEVAGEAWEPVR